MPLRESGDVDPDIESARRSELRDHTPGYDVQSLETRQDARERARIGISIDTQAERLRRAL
jgi:hypothetical protein